MTLAHATVDVAALREVTQRIIDLEAKRENAPDFAHRAAAHAALSMACETFAHTLPPTAVLALLDRLERLEEQATEAADVGMGLLDAMNHAELTAFRLSRDDLEDRLRALREVLPDVDRAALDDEAPR